MRKKTKTGMTMRLMGRMDNHHHSGAMCFIFAIKIAPLFWHQTREKKDKTAKVTVYRSPTKSEKVTSAL